MMSLFNLLVVHVLFIGVISGTRLGYGPFESQDENNQHQLGIIHGKLAPITKYPFMAALLRDGDLWGVAVILNENWLLTTAYLASTSQKVQLRVGSNKWKRGGRLVDISDVVIHENYTGTWKNDVAVIKTDSPLTFNRRVKSISLGSGNLKNNATGVVLGWGYVKGDYKSSSKKLRSAKNRYLNNTQCASHYGHDYDQTLFCSDIDVAGPCYSDYSAPFVVNHLVYGLFAGGDTCYSEPRLYVNIPELATWIQNAIKT